MREGPCEFKDHLQIILELLTYLKAIISLLEKMECNLRFRFGQFFGEMFLGNENAPVKGAFKLRPASPVKELAGLQGVSWEARCPDEECSKPWLKSLME